jgi:hypothetical protein
MESRQRRLIVLTSIAILVAAVAGCGGSKHNKATTAQTTVQGATTTANRTLSGSVSFIGIWTGAEANAFRKVIAAFNDVYPNIRINYRPVGNNVPTILATAVAGGNPPDMADIAQPGLIKQFADQNRLKPLTYAASTIAANYAPAWRQLGTVDGKLYALVFKAANKSTVWYNVPAFEAAGIAVPKTWTQLLTGAKTLKASGTRAYSIGGADGWTLTDMFENIYLRTFGPARYAALSAHRIKWTDPSVITALKTMAQVVGDSGNLAGGPSGALQQGFNDSVTNAFSTPPKGAMVFEGDFVAGVITSSTTAKPGSGFNVFPFPTTKAGSTGANGVVIGGDLFVTFRDTPAIEAFVKFLATAPAAEAWAKLGGFATGNNSVPPSIYPDPITRATALPVAQAKSVVFDMSDEQPAEFGGTTGQGEWGIFQEFLRNPSDPAAIAKKLESSASEAYKTSK